MMKWSGTMDESITKANEKQNTVMSVAWFPSSPTMSRIMRRRNIMA